MGVNQSETRRKQAPQQGQLEFPQHGGARKGAGRKPKGRAAGASHAARPEIKARHPLLVTQRMCAGLPSLRKPPELEVLRAVFAEANARDGFRIVHFSIQTNHVHYICEARDKQCLTRGMQSVGVKIARRLNQLWKRTGQVFAERYHARALETPSEVRNAIAYVLNNARKHGLCFAGADPFSSGAWFDGWTDGSALSKSSVRDAAMIARQEVPTAAAETWLLCVGWRRRGLIHVHEIPGSRAFKRAQARDDARLADSIQRSLAAAAWRSPGSSCGVI
jgi:REP element-mobilizing transposase RayT